MGQARAIEIGLADAENLSFTLEPAKRGAVQYAVSIVLGRVPVVFAGRRRFRVLPLEQKVVHFNLISEI